MTAECDGHTVFRKMQLTPDLSRNDSECAHRADLEAGEKAPLEWRAISGVGHICPVCWGRLSLALVALTPIAAELGIEEPNAPAPEPVDWSDETRVGIGPLERAPHTCG
jgi:hypothetical protein